MQYSPPLSLNSITQYLRLYLVFIHYIYFLLLPLATKMASVKQTVTPAIITNIPINLPKQPPPTNWIKAELDPDMIANDEDIEVKPYIFLQLQTNIGGT